MKNMFFFCNQQSSKKMMVVCYNSKFSSIFHQTLRETNIFSSISWLIFYENITFRYLSFFNGIFLYGFRLRYFFICYFAIWHYNLAIFNFFININSSIDSSYDVPLISPFKNIVVKHFVTYHLSFVDFIILRWSFTIVSQHSTK